MDCIKDKDCSTGASGPDDYWEYAKSKGSMASHNYPYEEKDGECRYDVGKVLSFVKDWGNVNSDAVDIYEKL